MLVTGLGSREGLEGRTERIWQEFWQEFWQGVLDRDPGGCQGSPPGCCQGFWSVLSLNLGVLGKGFVGFPSRVSRGSSSWSSPLQLSLSPFSRGSRRQG